MVLANVGVFAAWIGPIQVLLAQQADAIDSANKEFVFGLVTGVGAAISVVANPVFGAVSDLTTSRFGRRAPWVLAGAIGGVAGLLILAVSGSTAGMLLGWCLVQLFCNALLAAITAAVPDQVPTVQRGVGRRLGRARPDAGWRWSASGWPRPSAGSGAGYLACAIFLLVSVLPYLRTQPGSTAA